MAVTRGVTFRDVSYRYPGVDRDVLQHLDWTIREGSFNLLAGPSGSGKSTMLRCLNGLTPHFSGGRFGGEVSVHGLDTRRHPPRALARECGFVFQDPDAQSLTGRVEDDIAFGMEQLGVPPTLMRKRVEEVLDLVGIAPLRTRAVATLSGGERQRVAIAGALAMQPRLLALDEPTSQLDPWGAEEVLTVLQRLNEDLGITVVLSEHRLDRVVGHADTLRLLLPGGEIADGAPRDVLRLADPLATPPVYRAGQLLGWDPIPLTVKEGRAAWHRRPADLPTAPLDPRRPAAPPALELDRVTVGYGGRPVLEGIRMSVRPGEVVALMGRNGSGKTTLLRSILGLHPLMSGRLLVAGQDVATVGTAALARSVGYLPQRGSALLLSGSVREELALGPAPADPAAAERAGLAHLMDRHPHDLSVGEQERLAVGITLQGGRPVLLLDEPTRGLDGARKAALATQLREAAEAGAAVVLSTHDVELAASLATRVIILGDGEIIAEGGPREVLAGSFTFSTQVNKVFGEGYLTVEDLVP